MKKTMRAPGDLEMAVLEVLWLKGPSKAKDVQEVLSSQRQLAYSTVLTVMRRMEAKGMLRRKKISRSHVYETAIDKGSMRKASVKDLLARLFGESPSELVMHLVKDQKISAKELEKIEALISGAK